MITKTTQEYLVIIGKGNLWPLKDRFKELGGFFTGSFWAFPIESETEVRELLQNFNEIQVHKQPMHPGQTFESYRHTFKASFFKKLLKELEEEISRKTEYLNIQEVSEEIVDSLSIDEWEKNEITKLLEQRNSINFQISHTESMAEALSSSNEPKPIKIQSISEISEDYFSKEPPEKPPLLSYEKDGDPSAKKIPFLHKEVTAMLVAEGGRGKTHFCAHLATCITSGVPFLGKFKIVSPGPVCMIVGENNDEDIKRLLFKSRNQIEKMLKKNKEEKEDYKRFPTDGGELSRIASLLFPISVHGMQASLVDGKGKPTDFFHHLLRELKSKEPEQGFQLIIFDPASRFAGAESEKDNAVATAFISQLEHISNSLKGKPTILLSHHRSKAATKESSGQTDARGASALVDGARWMATLTPDDNDDFLTFLSVPKTNFTPPIERMSIKKTWDGLMSFEGFNGKKR